MYRSLRGPCAFEIGSVASGPLELLNLVILAIREFKDHVQDCLLLRNANLYELHHEKDFKPGGEKRPSLAGRKGLQLWQT